MKNVLILFGGGGSEHEISKISFQYLKAKLESLKRYNIISAELIPGGCWKSEKGSVALTWNRELKFLETNETLKVDYLIPCFHGFPGETGNIQSFAEMCGLPYLGCNSEASFLCFNKVNTKLWAERLKVPVVPFVFFSSVKEKDLEKKAREFLQKNNSIVVKATNQGSSVGCYLVENEQDLLPKITEAFQLSPFVLLEKRVDARELEVSAYEYEGKIHVSKPGEIIVPSKFYSFEEKYDQSSQAVTHTSAQGLSDETIKQIQSYAQALFNGLNLRHLARIDFFLERDIVYLNEINTFPGLTPISMFPKMLEQNGHDFSEFLRNCIER